MNLNMKRQDSWTAFNRSFVQEGTVRGYAVEHLLPSEPCPEVRKYFEGSGFKAHIFPGWNSGGNEMTEKQHDLRLGWECWRRVRREKYDLVSFHFCNEVAVLLFILLTSLSSCKPRIVWHQHSNITPLPAGFHPKRVFSKLRVLSWLVDKVCPVFRKQEQILIDRGLSPGKVTAIYNGIDPERFKAPFDKEAYRRDLGLKSDTKVVLTVGSLIERKRVDLFIRAAAEVVKKENNVTFLIAGEGPLLEQLKKLVEELGLTESVRFLGRRSDVDRLLRIGNIFVLSSSAEGFPLVNIEACAAGAAVVSTDVSGVSELIRDGETGYLTRAGDAQMIAEKILMLFQDPGKAREVVARAQKTVFEQFSLQKMVDSYYALYGKLLK